MPNPRLRQLASVLAIATATLTIAGLILLALTLDHPPQGGWGFRGFPTIFAIAAGSVGWLIMTRRPENRIGLVLAVVGLLNAAQLFLTEYAAAGTRTSLPASNFAAWVNAFVWVPTLAMMAGVTPLLFPDGRLPSRAWRPAAWVLAIGTLGVVLSIAVYPSALGTPRVVERALRLPIADEVINQVSYIALLVTGIGISLGASSLVLRWRRATGVVREQLKWLALSVIAVAATMWLSVIPNPVLNSVFIVAIGSVPIAVGIAVLRHGLYEIDAVINRTLVFGVLTAILTGAFAALLKLLQTIFIAATGNESDAATVITTLILATAFVPLKHAVEGIVERRVKPLAETSAGVPAAAATDDLEGLLRRVVREEIQAALHEPEAGTPAQ
ncbi:MAG TPA: hypothetical protein VFC71_01605 [Candidatus Polarisedimenticolia bacterium]|nr:hypothetical protein [Candidatus Polarisedimenticolia bacterium]